MGKWIQKCGIAAAFLALAVVLVAAVLLPGIHENEAPTDMVSEDVTQSAADSALETLPANAEPQKEFRAVWVPAFCLSMAGETDRSETAFQKKYDQILQEAIDHHMNAMIVQIRPFSDAFYPSALFPWSANLTGEQGQDPGYDPLKYMVESTHKAGLEFHAWINPLRIRMNGVPTEFAEDSLLSRMAEHSDWILSCTETNGIYLNPAIPEVRQYIADGVKEVVSGYAVDGVQFDDYFYPTQAPDYDAESYDAYCKETEEPMELLAWRQENINRLVQQVYQTVHENSDAVFGIAPQGNVENDLAMGADVELWGKTSGFVDYLCPQLYYNFENPVLPYDQAAEQWKTLVSNKEIQLYFGLGLYKAGSDVDQGTWQNSDSILADQVQLGRQIGCNGFCFYSSEYWENENTKEEVRHVMALLN